MIHTHKHMRKTGIFRGLPGLATGIFFKFETSKMGHFFRFFLQSVENEKWKSMKTTKWNKQAKKALLQK